MLNGMWFNEQPLVRELPGEYKNIVFVLLVYSQRKPSLSSLGKFKLIKHKKMATGRWLTNDAFPFHLTHKWRISNKDCNKNQNSFNVNFVGGLWASAECEVCPDNSKVISIWTSLPLRQPRKPLLNVIIHNVRSIFTLNDSKDHLRLMTGVYETAADHIGVSFLSNRFVNVHKPHPSVLVVRVPQDRKSWNRLSRKQHNKIMIFFCSNPIFQWQDTE